MKPMHNTRLLFIQCFLFFLCLNLSAQTTKHVVSKGETLYRISVQHGTTVDALLRLNPGVTPETLQEGQELILPHTQQSVGAQKKVAVILPLESNSLEGTRSVEFYRGLLMAANRLCSDGQRIQINTYTETPKANSIDPILEELAQLKPDMIVGPVYPSHFTKLSQFAEANNSPLYIPFSSKAETIINHSQVNLVNPPVNYRNKLLAHLLPILFKDYRFTFLHYSQGDDGELANELKKLLTANKIVFTSFNADAPIAQMHSAIPKNKATIVIPDSSRPEHVKDALNKMIQYHSSYPQRAVALMGLMEWNDVLQAYDHSSLYATDIFIPTTSAYNANDPQTQAVEREYKKLFRTDLLATTPKMALLGYDIGMKLFGKGTQADNYQETQSRISFTPISKAGGKVLNSIFLYHYKPTQQIDLISPKVDVSL